jgi:hypothetical protein
VPYARHSRRAAGVAGFVLLVELASFTTIGAAQGKKFSIGGHLIDTTAPLPWVVALSALVLARCGCAARHAAFRQRWDELMEGAKIQMARYRRQGAGGDVVSRSRSVPAVELRDVCKKFGATEIIRGVISRFRVASAMPSSAPTAPARPRCST